MSTDPDKKIPLVEMFGPVLQGEGVLIGAQTTFLRFGLCDYKCAMCDSMHAVDPNQVRANAEWLTQDQIAEKLMPIHRKFKTPWVTFSGGNPCIHDLGALVQSLQIQGVRVSVETQGTFSPGWLSLVDQLTISPKSPGMGAKFSMKQFKEFMHQVMVSYDLGRKASLKVVIFTAADIEFLKGINEIAESYGMLDRIYASVGNADLPKMNDQYSLAEHRRLLLDEMAQNLEDLLKEPSLSNVRYLPQLHVLLYGNRQGV